MVEAPERICAGDWRGDPARLGLCIAGSLHSGGYVEYLRADIAAGQLAEARAEIERVRDGNRYFQLEAMARRELAKARAERDRLAADNARLREALERIQRRYKAEHLSEFCYDIARAALAGKE